MRLEVGNVGILSVGNTSAVLDSQIRKNALCRALSYDLESKQLYHTQLGTPEHFRAGPLGPLQIYKVIPFRAVPYGSCCSLACCRPSNALARVTRAHTMPTAPKRKAMAPARRPMKRQGPSQKQYSFQRTAFFNGNLTSPASGTTIPFVSDTVANNIPGFAEIQASFDQFKIRKVQYTYSVRFDSVESIETVVGNLRLLPRLTYVRDYNDVTPAASLSALGEYDNCASKRMDKPVVITYVPEARGSHGPLPNQWIDTATGGNVQHFGHKGIIDLWTSNYGTDLKVDLQIKYWFDCKNLR